MIELVFIFGLFVPIYCLASEMVIETKYFIPMYVYSIRPISRKDNRQNSSSCGNNCLTNINSFNIVTLL